jgi:hypothetical protein
MVSTATAIRLTILMPPNGNIRRLSADTPFARSPNKAAPENATARFDRAGRTRMTHSKAIVVVSWILRGITAVILLQTLFFKFTAAKESVYIFSTLGLEPWGRIGTGVAELIAATLLLIPSTVAYGAIISLGVISGAIFSHLTKLGITLPAVDDHGELFSLAVTVFVCSAAILFLHRHELPVVGGYFSVQHKGI